MPPCPSCYTGSAREVLKMALEGPFPSSWRIMIFPSPRLITANICVVFKLTGITSSRQHPLGRLNWYLVKPSQLENRCYDCKGKSKVLHPHGEMPWSQLSAVSHLSLHTGALKNTNHAESQGSVPAATSFLPDLGNQIRTGQGQITLCPPASP